MKAIVKYFVDFYIDIIEYAKTKGLNVDESRESSALFQAFLSLALAFMFGSISMLSGILAGVVAVVTPVSPAILIVSSVLTGLIMIVFIIFMFVKFAEGFDLV